MYRIPGERDEYEAEDETPALSTRERVAALLYRLTLRRQLPGFVVGVTLVLLVLALSEVAGFAAFAYEPLTVNGQPASFVSQLLFAPVVTFMGVVMIGLAVITLWNLRGLFRFVYNELSLLGDVVLRNVARRLDKNVD